MTLGDDLEIGDRRAASSLLQTFLIPSLDDDLLVDIPEPWNEVSLLIVNDDDCWLLVATIVTSPVEDVSECLRQFSRTEIADSEPVDHVYNNIHMYTQPNDILCRIHAAGFMACKNVKLTNSKYNSCCLCIPIISHLTW